MVNVYETIDGKDVLKEVISLYEYNKRNDICKFYKNKLKQVKDIEKYVKGNKELKVYNKFLGKFNCTGGYCKVMQIEILDLDNKYVGNGSHYIDVYYNNYTDLAKKDVFYKNFDTDYKQEIYKIMY